jgi:hypothetical protein
MDTNDNAESLIVAARGPERCEITYCPMHKYADPQGAQFGMSARSSDPVWAQIT